MKKNFLLLAFSVLFISCSSDDSKSLIDTSSDPIIGVWKLSKYVTFYKDGTQTEHTPHRCDIMGTTEYLADNNTLHGQYSSNINDVCEKDPTNYTYYRWSRIEEHKYKFELLINNDESSLIEEIHFPDNKSFYIVQLYSGSDTGSNELKEHIYYTRQ